MKKGCFSGLVVIMVFCFIPFSVFSQNKEKSKSPKNIILMIGDGMGYNQIMASDYYNARKQTYEDFPVKVSMSTYPAKAGSYSNTGAGTSYYAGGYNTLKAWRDTAYLKSDYTESAAAATAMATGFKTYNNAIGMSVKSDTLENMTEFAKSLSRSAGVVTSVEFSHATPAGFVAHNKTRINNSQIAYQMLLDSRIDLIMGCGNPAYDDNGVPVSGAWKSSRYVGDSAFWDQLNEGSGKSTLFTIGSKTMSTQDCDGDGTPDPWTIIDDVKEFRELKKGSTPKRILGCPKVYSTLQQMRKMSAKESSESEPYVTPFIPTVPSLEDMSLGALNFLSKNRKGFFLMIEGGAIDWACHSNQKGRMIEEMRSFDDAVKAVVNWVTENSNWNETLVIVTGDHETGMLWGNGPFRPLKNNGVNKLPEMTFFSDDHTNSLVALFAKGKGSDWFNLMADENDSVRGPYIQNSEIPLLIRFLWSQ